MITIFCFHTRLKLIQSAPYGVVLFSAMYVKKYLLHSFDVPQVSMKAALVTSSKLLRANIFLLI